jgi:hypothetical protein
VLLGRGRPGEELAGAVQEHDAARSAPPWQGTVHIWARRPPDARPRLPRYVRGPRPRPACATWGRARTDRWATPCAADDEPGSSTWRSGLQGRPWCAQRLGKARPLGRRGARTARRARRGVGRPDLFHSASVWMRIPPKF